MGNRHWINELFRLAAMTPSREQIYSGPGEQHRLSRPTKRCATVACCVLPRFAPLGDAADKPCPDLVAPMTRRPAATAGGLELRQVLRYWRLDQARRHRPGEGVYLEATVFQFMAGDTVTNQRMSQMTV